MLNDGTIVLLLRVDQDDLIGDTRIMYGPHDPQYAYILGHLGGLEHGQQKLVRPFS